MTVAVIGVGSNQGSRVVLIERAAELLAQIPKVELVARAPIYESEPLTPPQPKYLNTAFRLETELEAQELLKYLLSVERKLGRVRSPGQRWASRTIDLDLLWFGGVAIDEPGLCVPHRELEKRDFALRPLLDVAPELDSTYRASLDSLGPGSLQRIEGQDL